MITESQVVRIIGWAARVSGLCLFLFWGAFFVEHSVEWFFTPWPKLPPVYVWVSQCVHLILLISYIIAMRWHLTGGLLIIISSFVFLFDKAGSGFILFFSISIIPAGLYLFYWWRSKKISHIDRETA